MDKYNKRIKRRDFIRVVGGALVATELGVAGCAEENSDPSGSDSGQGGFGLDGGQPMNTGGLGPGGASGSSSGAGGGLAGTGGSGGPGATSGSGGTEPVVTAGSGGSAGQTSAEAGAGGSAGAAGQPSAGEGGSAGAAGQPSAGTGAGGSGGAAGQPSAGAGAGGSGGSPPQADAGPDDSGKSKIYIVKPPDRTSGISQVMAMAGGLGFAAGRDVVLKPNYNSSGPLPASTHDDTIRQIVADLRTAGAGNITLGESSGSRGTDPVIAEKGTLNLCSELGIDFVSYDAPDTEYETFQFDGMTWTGGLAIPKLMRSDRVKILMPCCKTHILADFTLSLKLAVGLVPRDRRWGDMHLSFLHEKIADINRGFEPDLIVMDAMRCFIDNGPDTGTTAEPGLILAGTDRVAMDAVGLAILKAAGSNTAAIRRRIFEQPQIMRAVEIGLGATSPDDIELIGDDDATISELRSILDDG